MQDLDKAALGARIRAIRNRAGLRQWELARLLGTTQSAVHKYEHGVVPEPRRLVELSRIGNTSIEWILTGKHWENGSEEQSRLTPDLLETASALRGLAESERSSVDDALRIVREAVHALDSSSPDGVEDPLAWATALRNQAPDTLRVLEAACRIQRAVLRWITESAARRLDASALGAAEGAEATRARAGERA